jgi:hypothetical protein
LVPQREVFEDQGAVGPDPAEEADEDEGDHAGHHRSGRPKVNVDEADGVNRRHRFLKAIEQKIAGQEIQRVEVEARPPTTDLVATLKAILERKGPAKASPAKSKTEPTAKRPARRRRAS